MIVQKIFYQFCTSRPNKPVKTKYWITTSKSFACRFLSGWIYKDEEENYCNRQIEKNLISMSGGSIDLATDKDSGIGFIKINNPARKNALTGKMIYDLRVAVNTLYNWKDGKAVILHGTNHSFCSGADLSTVRRMSSSKDGEDMCMYMQNTLTMLQRLPMITVAFIEGKALGGGAELITACDFRIITEDGEIGYVHKKMGLIPGWGGVTRLVQMIGAEKALMLLASAQNVEAHRALNIGLVNHLVLLSQRDIFHEIHIRAHPELDTEHRSYAPDCAVHNAIDWLQRNFDLDNTHTDVLRAIKSSVTQCSSFMFSNSSLKREKDIFKTLWGAEANLNALAVSKHGNN